MSEAVVHTPFNDATCAAVRAAMLEEVPALAVVRVTGHDVASPWPLEYLAHRLGQVPLVRKAERKATYTLRVRAKGPCELRSDRLKSDEIAAADDHILIAPLPAGASLDLELEIEYARPIEHARHQAVVAPRFQGGVITYETTGGLTHEEIWEHAIELTARRLDAIAEALTSTAAAASPSCTPGAGTSA
jgi:hypothetical protein